MAQVRAAVIGRVRRHPLMGLAIAAGGAAIVARMVLDSNFAESAVFYVFVPFSLSLALYFLTGKNTRDPWWSYRNLMRNSTIVMLVASALLYEGFLCVLLYMPIHYLVVSLAFLAIRLYRDRRTRPAAVLLVAAIVASSAEGVTAATSFARLEAVSATRIVAAGVDRLKRNMARPIVFDAPRPWFLRLFPLAESVEAGSLRAGDVHRLHFVYRKWIVTNAHSGSMALRIKDVGEHSVTTEVVANDAYFSHYADIRGTAVEFLPLDGGRTRVTLTVRYRRLLDPAWYFAPIQRLVIGQAAEYLIATVIARELDHE